MTARSSKQDEFDLHRLDVGRLTWMGLTLAGIGWALLLGETAVSDFLVRKVPRPLPPTFHADLIDIAKSIIVSGFGLAVVGALQNGFGTLNRFFGAVLMRSGQRGPAERSSQPSIEGRPYRTFRDGSVEVETIVGTRRFKSMAEARDFI